MGKPSWTMLLGTTLAMTAVCAAVNGQSRNTEHTLKLDDPSSQPKASVEDVAWLAGSWQGEAFGGSVEEIWHPSFGGTMTGVFKLVVDGEPSMYEFMKVVSTGGSLELRLKHFDRDFKGWEERAEFVSFPLVRLEDQAAYFEGLSYRRVDADQLLVHVSIGEEKEEMEIVFTGRAGRSEPGHSPYAGMESRSIKALSEQEVASYRSGEGMGFAMAAELNDYPGPKHVLELEEELELTPDQVVATRKIFDAMHEAAVALGDRIVAAEGRLDDRFADREISPKTLEQATAEIARLRGELRAVHLRAHLEMAAALTAEQRHAYRVHRGYGDGSMPAGHHPGMQHRHGH